MLLLQLTLLFGLVAGGKSIFLDLYHRAGDEVILPCSGLNSSETSCSRIKWSMFQFISDGTDYKYDSIVHDGQIQVDSPLAAKVSLDRRCSLTIRNISSEDAGYYYCYYENRFITYVLLNILTLSADQSMDPEGGVTLTCTLWRSKRLYCDRSSLVLMDEEGDELERKYGGYTPGESCPFLTITHQSNHSRQYTCQFVTDDGVQISADYPLVSTAKPIYLYHRAGDEVILPCNSVDSSETSCSSITWKSIRNSSAIVHDGQIQVDSPLAAKVSLDRRCSLTIRNISSEDAGRYSCYYGNRFITYVFLSILTFSADQSMDPGGGVTLTCTLWRNHRYFCERSSLVLMDEEGAKRWRKNENYGPAEMCPSFLTITHQSNHSRQYTCQFVTDDGVQISADYTLGSTVHLTSEPTPNKIIFIILMMFLLILLVVIVTTVQIKYRRRTGAAEGASLQRWSKKTMTTEHKDSQAQDQDCVPDEEHIYDDVGPAQHQGLIKEEEEEEDSV